MSWLCKEHLDARCIATRKPPEVCGLHLCPRLQMTMLVLPYGDGEAGGGITSRSTAALSGISSPIPAILPSQVRPLLWRSLNIPAVAEGIEGWQQLEKLGQLGCTFAQGYLFAKPVPQEACARYLRGVPIDLTEPHDCPAALEAAVG